MNFWIRIRLKGKERKEYWLYLESKLVRFSYWLDGWVDGEFNFNDWVGVVVFVKIYKK